jgi:N-acetyl-alpha-D-glucosaminyl L-malate synthase BshA
VKIAVLCFHTLGGSGVVAAELARELAKRGHELHFVGAALPGRLDPPPEKVTFHEVPYDDAPPAGLHAYTTALAARLAQVCREERIDLIHAHYAIPHAAAASLARSALGKSAPPLVLTMHGSDVPMQPDAGLRFLLADFARNAAALTVPSESLAIRAKETLDRELRIEVIPNFVDIERFHPLPSPRSGSKVLVHASNFRAVKRPLDLLRILRRVPGAKLLLVGDGPLRSETEAEARREKLDVEFIHETPDLAPVLRRGDLFLLPSAAESFGLAALEAMASGVPVVGTRVGGLPEVVGDSGVLCAPGDIAAMSDAVNSLLTNDSQRLTLAKAARDRAVKLFAAPKTLDRWESLYQRVRKERP